MIKVEKIDVHGFEAGIRGMRSPMNSWDKSDTQYFDRGGVFRVPKIGGNDLKLMKSLAKAGPEHRKYLRMLTVTMDITAPLYWWKEYDTYKVGTVANSCSTMHKIHEKEFTLDDFSCEHLNEYGIILLEQIVDQLNEDRELFIEDKDKNHWWQLIQLLPSSYNQRRTVMINYETVLTMIKQRSGHKLDEWNDFVAVLKDLPYIKELIEEV